MPEAERTGAASADLSEIRPTKHLLEQRPDGADWSATHEAQTLAMGFFVQHRGAGTKLPAELGASHFLEHLMFKGSLEPSAPPDLNARLDALGGQANALYQRGSHRLPRRQPCRSSKPNLLSTLSVLLSPALRPEEVDTERGVILEEIEMYADQPDSRLMDTPARRVLGRSIRWASWCWARRRR